MHLDDLLFRLISFDVKFLYGDVIDYLFIPTIDTKYNFIFK